MKLEPLTLMMLTGLFALLLSGVSLNVFSESEGFNKTAFLAVLFVLIGCCIDIGKYLFWRSVNTASILWYSVSL